MTSRYSAVVYRFASYELDPARLELKKSGVRVRLSGKPMEALLALLERPGDVVTREDLRKRLWGADTFVEFEDSLNHAIRRVREALDDDPKSPRFIETVPGAGYRFIAGVQESKREQAPPEAGAVNRRPTQPDSPGEFSVSGRTIRFGIFEADFAARELRKRGVRIKLQEQPFRLLEALLERPAEIVTRDELREALWDGSVFVDFDKSLNTAAQKLRQALGDSADTPHFVETVARHGYRFIAPVQRSSAAALDAWNEQPAPTATKPKALVWTLAAACALGFVALANLFLSEPERQPPVRRFSIAPEATGAGLLRVGTRGGFSPIELAVISPDGSQVAYRSNEQPHRLWTYRFDSGLSRPLTGTEGGSHFFWSPDSRHLAFFAQGVLKRVARDGGSIVSICALPSSYEWIRGGAWSPDGDRIVMSIGSGGGFHLYSVPVGGGEPRRILEELANPTRPHFLPSGAQTLLVSQSASTYVVIHQAVDLESGKITPISISGEYPFYSPSGHILFVDDNNVLWAAPFSPERLEITGDAFLVAAGVGPPSVSNDGTIVAPALSGASTRWRQLTVRGRDGERLDTVEPPLYLTSNPAVSPDGKSVAVSASNREGLSPDIWLFEFGRPVGRRLVADELTLDHPAWHPNGRELVFRKQSDSDRNADFFIVDVAGGSPARPLLATDEREAEPAWSPDGGTLIYQTASLNASDFDIRRRVRVREDALGEPVTFVGTEFNEAHPQFSPDGRFVAYDSRETGVTQIYVRPFPEGAAAWRVSEHGGTAPRWNRAGDELYWIRRDELGEVATLVAARMDLGSTTPVGEIQTLFETEMVRRGTYMYDVTPDGRFVIVEPALERNQPAGEPYFQVIQNWTQLDPALGETVE